MEIVLDSVAVNHILRSPAKAKQRGKALHHTCLDALLARSSIRIMIDPQKALVDEWGKTCGLENIKNLVNHWDQWGGMVAVKKLGKIPQRVAKQLRLHGFAGTIDKLVLKIAIVTADRVVVSEDSDFWDPRAINPRICLGDANSPVAKCCVDHLNVQMLTVAGLMIQFRHPQ